MLREAIEANQPSRVEEAMARTKLSLLNQHLDNGATPLQLAAHLGQWQTVAYLLDQADIEPNLANASGWTPLLEAAAEGHVDIARMLLSHPRMAIDCEALSMAFFLALEGGHTAVAQLLLSHGADVHQRMDGLTPLQRACQLGHAGTVRWLLTLPDIDLFQPGPQGQHALHFAGMNTEHPEHVLAFQDLLPTATFRALVDAPDAWGARPAALAAERGQRPAVMAALKPTQAPPPMATRPTSFQRGWTIVGDRHVEWEDRNLLDVGEGTALKLQACGDGKTPLTWARLQALDVQPGDLVACTFHSYWDASSQRVMMELGPDEDVPLVEVARLFYEKGVRRMLFLGCEVAQAARPLLQRFANDPDMSQPADRRKRFEGMDITVVGGDGPTLTSLNLDAMGFWLQDGAQVSRTGALGDAFERLSVQPMSRIEWSDDIQDLVIEQRGARDADALHDLDEVEAQEARIDLMLLHAGDNELDKLKHLLDAHDVDPNAQNSAGDTALRVASEAGHLAVVESLLARDANVDLSNMHGCSPLFSASGEGRVEVVARLLRAGADPGLMNRAGTTPLALATALGHNDVVDLLQQSIRQREDGDALWV